MTEIYSGLNFKILSQQKTHCPYIVSRHSNVFIPSFMTLSKVVLEVLFQKCLYEV